MIDIQREFKIIEENMKKSTNFTTVAGIIHPKVSHKFRARLISPNLTEQEKDIFTLQIVNLNIQESFIGQNSNLFTMELEDDIYNGVVNLIPKIQNAEFSIENLDGDCIAYSTVNLYNCKLLFTRTSLDYGKSEAVRLKLVYSFEKLERVNK